MAGGRRKAREASSQALGHGQQICIGWFGSQQAWTCWKGEDICTSKRAASLLPTANCCACAGHHSCLRAAVGLQRRYA